MAVKVWLGYGLLTRPLGRLPGPDTVLEAGDRLHVSGALAGVRIVAERLGSLGKEG